VSDFLEEKRQEITDRLKELKPLVDEHRRLEAAAEALAKVGGSKGGGSSSAAAAPRRKKKGPGRPRGSRTRRKAVKAAAAAEPAAAASEAATPKVERKKVGRHPGSGKKVGRPAGKVGRAKGKAGRRKGGGKRATEAVSFVQGQPGITIPELANKMGIKQNYLYRVLPGLEQEGKLEKKGRGWHPKGA
jgi:hypothetical protein